MLRGAVYSVVVGHEQAESRFEVRGGKRTRGDLGSGHVGLPERDVGPSKVAIDLGLQRLRVAAEGGCERFGGRLSRGNAAQQVDRGRRQRSFAALGVVDQRPARRVEPIR